MVLDEGPVVKKRRPVVERWVVYRSHLAGEHGGNAVCEQAEWDAMESASPGQHTLLRSGIASEAEAERLARELPGGTTVRGVSPKVS
jgi:hypothetical protein